jgi:hypothetical protein
MKYNVVKTDIRAHHFISLRKKSQSEGRASKFGGGAFALGNLASNCKKLELKFQSQHHLPGCGRTVVLSESSAGLRAGRVNPGHGIDRIVLRVVERVVRFPAELQTPRFIASELEVLEE